MTEHRWYELWGVWLEPREVLEQPPSSRVPCSYRDCGCTGLVGRISVDGVLLMQSRSGFVIKAEGGEVTHLRDTRKPTESLEDPHASARTASNTLATPQS
jgi:hypothetical protein